MPISEYTTSMFAAERRCNLGDGLATYQSSHGTVQSCFLNRLQMVVSLVGIFFVLIE